MNWSKVYQMFLAAGFGAAAPDFSRALMDRSEFLDPILFKGIVVIALFWALMRSYSAVKDAEERIIQKRVYDYLDRSRSTASKNH